MRYAILIFVLVLVPKAFACDLKDADKKVIVKQTGERGLCKDVSVLFPKEMPSKDSWIWDYSFLMFQVRKDGQLFMDLRFPVSSSKRQNYLRTSFCLPDDIIREGVLTIVYEEESREEPTGGLVSISFCNEVIVIDNLDELLAESNQLEEVEK